MDSLNLAYTILTVGDKREEQKKQIRSSFSNFPEVFVDCVDCTNDSTYQEMLKQYSHMFTSGWKPESPGELGVWISHINAWKYAAEMEYDALLIMEDDARMLPFASEKMMDTIDLLPDNWDSLSLWMSSMQYDKFFLCPYGYRDDAGDIKWEGYRSGELPGYNLDRRIICPAQQVVGLVATIITKAGAKKLLKALEDYKMFHCVDVFFFQMVKSERLKAYTVAPGQSDIVWINWETPSIIWGQQPPDFAEMFNSSDLLWLESNRDWRNREKPNPQTHWAYTIITVDDSREEKKADIRKYMQPMDEVFIPWVDCREPDKHKAARVANIDLFTTKWENVVPGEFGVFLSQINAWKYAEDMDYGGLIVFEDDALLNEDTHKNIEYFASLLPKDWDTFSVFVPDSEYQEFYTHRFLNDRNMKMLNIIPEGAAEYLTKHKALAKAYQGFSCVATAISPSGGKKLNELVKRNGMYAPVDIAIFEWAKAGEINAYAPTPPYCDMVSIRWGDWSVIRGDISDEHPVWL